MAMAQSEEIIGAWEWGKETEKGLVDVGTNMTGSQELEKGTQVGRDSHSRNAEGFKEQGFLIFSCNTAHPTITLQLFTESCYLAFRLLCGIDVKGSMFHIWVEIVYLQGWMNRPDAGVQARLRTRYRLKLLWESWETLRRRLATVGIPYSSHLTCADNITLKSTWIWSEPLLLLHDPINSRGFTLSKQRNLWWIWEFLHLDMVSTACCYLDIIFERCPEKKGYWRFLFSRPGVSDSLQLHRLQHTRPPCPSPSPEVCPSSCSLHQWHHPVILSADALFSWPQSLPASGTFLVSCLLTSDNQSIGASASASVLPVNIQGWSPLSQHS